MSELTKRPEPYVGVSGVVNPEQQKLIEDSAESIGLHASRRLALGVKAVHKTQFLDVQNKYGEDWYPVGREQFANALSPKSEKGSSLAVAQAFFDPEYVDNPGYRTHFSDRIFHRGEAWIDGIQFDMLPWHSNLQMLDFLVNLKQKQKHNTKKLFLQVHKPAMEELGPQGVAERLSEYSEAIDYVLFDSSHGTGTRLNVDALKPFLEQAYETTALDPVGFAIAGGLNGDVIREELPRLVEVFPDISWDAEGQLHPEKPNRTKPLNMSLVDDYLQASADVTKQ